MADEEWEQATVHQIQPIMFERTPGNPELFDFFGIVRIGKRFTGFTGAECCRDRTFVSELQPGQVVYRRVRDGAISNGYYVDYWQPKTLQRFRVTGTTSAGIVSIEKRDPPIPSRFKDWHHVSGKSR